jgi:hypothetical protein
MREPMRELVEDRTQSGAELRRSTPMARRGILFVCAIATACFYLTYLNAVPDYRSDQKNDSFTYITLAHGLQQGSYPTKHWMPGFPMIVSLATFIFGLNFTALKLVMVGFAAAALASSYWLYRQLTDPALAAVMTVLLAFCPAFFDYSHRLMSEIPSLATMMLSLAIAERLRQPCGRKEFWLLAGGLSLSSIAALAIRGNSLALVPAFAYAVVFSSNYAPRYRVAILLGLASIIGFYGLWSLRNSQRTYTGINNVTYFQEVQVAGSLDKLWERGGLADDVERATAWGFMTRAAENLGWSQIYRIADCFVPGSFRLTEVSTSRLGVIVALTLCIPTVVGWFSLFRRSPASAITLACSLALIAVYPTGSSVRMLIPSLGLIVVSCYSGLQFLLGQRAALTCACMAAISGCVVCLQQADLQARQPYADPRMGVSLEAFHELDRVAQKGDRAYVAVFNEAAQALLPDLQILDPTQPPAASTLPGGAYLVFPDSERDRLKAFLPPASEVVYSKGGATIVRFQRR